MSVAARWCTALLLGIGVAGAGCDHPSPGAASQQPAPLSDQPTPRAEPVGVPQDPLVEVTPRAAQSVREVVGAQSVTGAWALRLTASWPKGICSPQHKLEIDTNPPSADDYAFESGGLRVVVLKRQVEMFRGAQVDHGEKDGRQGFLVDNPNFAGESLKKWGPIVANDPLSDGK